MVVQFPRSLTTEAAATQRLEDAMRYSPPLRRELLWGLSTVALALLFLASPAWPGSCSDDCAEEVGCLGSCSIDSADCSASCFATACKVTCKEFGPRHLDCGYVENVTCTKLGGPPPKAGAAPGGLGHWAVVTPLFATRPYAPEQITVVAASSQEFGRVAASDLAERLIANPEPESQRGKRWEDDTEGRLAGRLPELFVAPAEGLCVGSEVALLERKFPHAPGRRVGAYVKGITDGAGRLTSLEVLYTGDPEWSDQIVAFGMRHLRVWSPAAAGIPMELYGALMVSAEGAAGYIIGGVFAPYQGELWALGRE